MRPNAPITGLRRGPFSAIRPQPRQLRAAELAGGTPTQPWGSRRLPRTLHAGDHRRTLFRSLLRRAEGVPVEFADGERGVVAEVVFAPLGFEFWPVALLVFGNDADTTAVRRRVPVGRVLEIDVRQPRIVVADAPEALSGSAQGGAQSAPASVRSRRHRPGVRQRLVRRPHGRRTSVAGR